MSLYLSRLIPALALIALTGCDAIEKRQLQARCQPLDMPAAGNLEVAPQAKLPDFVPAYPGAMEAMRRAGTRGAFSAVVQPFFTDDSVQTVIDFYAARFKAAGIQDCGAAVFNNRTGQISTARDKNKVVISLYREGNRTQGSIEVYEPLAK